MTRHDEPLEIHVDGQQIEGTLLFPPEAANGTAPGMLFVHGWGGNQEQYLARAREITHLGCVCLTFDLRGHAGTQPQHDFVTRADNLRDVLAAYDLLAQHRAVDASSMGVVGSSYGGYLAAILTSLRAVRWLAMRAPALYKDSNWDSPKRQLNQDPDLKAYRRRPIRPEDNRALCACSGFRGDVLLVASEHDTVVPQPVAENYIVACAHTRSLTYRTLLDADHGLTDERWRQMYTNLLVGWLREMITGVQA